MITDMILSGQMDNYLLLSELFKNLEPEEIWNEFMKVANVVCESWDKIILQAEKEDIFLIPELYFDKFDKPNFCVYANPRTNGAIYEIYRPISMYISRTIIIVSATTICSFTEPSDEFKNTIINLLS